MIEDTNITLETKFKEKEQVTVEGSNLVQLDLSGHNNGKNTWDPDWLKLSNNI